jgi:GcrA cell cycle regulator
MWSDKDIALLRKAWAAGKSAGEISLQLQSRYSRSAVLGQVHRLGIQRKTMPGRVFDSSPRMSRGKRPAHQSPWPKKSPDKPRLEVEPYVEPVLTEVPQRKLHELEHGECHWPIGDPKDAAFGFCGAKAISGQSYCTGHHKRAYVAPVVKPREITVPAESMREREDEGVS